MNRQLTIDEYQEMEVSAPTRTRHLGRRLVGELFMMGAVFAIYRQIRFLTRNDTDAAMENATRVVDFERQFHFFSERTVQDVVMHSHTLVAFLNRYYVTVHFPLTVAFLLWVFFRHHDAYGRIRNTFVSVTVAALAIHVAFPLAPPRMLPDAGFVDTLQRFGPRIYSADTSESIANQFAAMPSLHFGWAFIVAGAYVSIRRTRRSLWVDAASGDHAAGHRRHGEPLLARRRGRRGPRPRRRRPAPFPQRSSTRSRPPGLHEPPPAVDPGPAEPMVERARRQRHVGRRRVLRRLVRRTGSRANRGRPPLGRALESGGERILVDQPT